MADPLGDAGEAQRIEASELELVDKIGTGRTAEVFNGIWKKQSVAVKRMASVKRHISKEDKLSFTREAKILAGCDHPNLVRMFGVCVVPDYLQIVCELCAGGSLFELLHNEQTELSECQQIKMCFDVARAMDYLHTFKPQIIHRDLKSLNLLLVRPIRGQDDTPTVKVADFGLSKILLMGDSMTKGVGTTQWMAPESFNRDDYTEKVDVFSYGIVMFEIICREPPYEDMNVGLVERHVKNGGRPDMEAVPPDFAPEPVHLMQRCWAHAQEDRPSFDEVVKSLRTVLENPGAGANDARAAPHHPGQRAADGYLSKSLARGPYHSVSL